MEIGTHIRKIKKFLPSLKAFYDDPDNLKKPCQIFHWLTEILAETWTRS